MDKALPTGPAISLIGVSTGLDIEKDVMTTHCLDREEVQCATW